MGYILIEVFFFVQRLHWLLPGRSTSLYLPENELVISMHARHKRQASKEGDCGPVHSPMNISRPPEQKHKQKQKKSNQNQTNTKHNQKPNTKKTSNTKPRHERITTRLEKLVAMASCVPCTASASKQSKTSKTNTNSRWPPEVRESNKSPCRNPGSDPGDHKVNGYERGDVESLVLGLFVTSKLVSLL